MEKAIFVTLKAVLPTIIFDRIFIFLLSIMAMSKLLYNVVKKIAYVCESNFSLFEFLHLE